jgi:hypothetical protein
MLPAAAALRHEPPARPQHRGKVAEQRVVVRDPVERRGRQDRVDGLVQRQRRREVRTHERGHVWTRGDRDVGAPRRASGRWRRARPRGRAAAARPAARDPSRATAGVEHPFIAGERQPFQHARPPPEHGIRDAVVRHGVPTRARPRRQASSAASTGPNARRTLERVRPQLHLDVRQAVRLETPDRVGQLVGPCRAARAPPVASRPRPSARGSPRTAPASRDPGRRRGTPRRRAR